MNQLEASTPVSSKNEKKKLFRAWAILQRRFSAAYAMLDSERNKEELDGDHSPFAYGLNTLPVQPEPIREILASMGLENLSNNWGIFEGIERKEKFLASNS